MMVGRRMAKHRVGVISDTHGLLRPEAVQALEGTELIIHAGDVGKPEVLEALRQVARVVAVRGNIDTGLWAQELPETAVAEVDGAWLYVLHDVKQLDLDPLSAGFRGVICGHSHRPSIEEKNGMLYVNPGSAGPRRFKLPVSVALLESDKNKLDARLVELRVQMHDV